MDIQSSYDSAAMAYTEHLFGELAQKPLDRHLLNRFAESAAGRGCVVDLGCGPGHVAAYLRKQCVDVFGVDLSPGMIACATTNCPDIEFRVGDMRALSMPDGGLAGAVAFYSIVHFTPDELETVFAECRRVLAPGALLLLAFHIGDNTNHLNDLFGQPVSLDFRFHQPANVHEALRAAGFSVIELTERAHYEGAEYPSRRSYMLAQAM